MAIWVLGNGQLGAMLRHAAMPLALDVRPVDITSPLEEALGADALITAEREHWPETDTALQLAQHPRFVSRRAFQELPDRKTQKQLLDRLELATATWRDLTVSTEIAGLHQQLGENVLLKRRTGGYDGKGQHWLRQQENSVIPDSWRGCAIAEQAVPFDDEASIIGVRNAAGECHFYPLTLNLHRDGILTASIAPLDRLQPLQSQAEAMLGKLMQELDYVGVMAMECFLVGGQLLVNEVAPRVHNSGHWTQAGSSISQFEYHLRALAGLPLAPAVVKGPTVMVNLIGVERDDRWLGVPGAEVFWYGKGVLPGRKVGHINLCTRDKTHLFEGLQSLRELLPSHYGATVDWILRNI